MLTGACMGRAGFNRKTAYATLTMLLAAEAADCDVLWILKGHTVAFEHHRGITHSFVGVPFMAAATLAGVYGLHRVWLRRRKPREGYPPVRWGLLYGLAIIAAFSHLLLDYTTAYGIRVFEPFNYRWYSWDIVSIIEPFILAVLILGLAIPWLFSLINQEIGARRKGPSGASGAIAALLFMVILWGYRDFQHRRALNAMSAITYNGASAKKMGVYPYWINPHRWLGVVETADFFQTMPINSALPAVDPNNEARTYYKPEETPVTRAAKSSLFGRVYLDWAAFPLVQVQPPEADSKDYIVGFRDLRYAYAGRNVLSGFVVVKPDLQVEELNEDNGRQDRLKTQGH